MTSVMSAPEVRDLARDLILDHLLRYSSDSLECIYRLMRDKNINRANASNALLALIESGTIIMFHGNVAITEEGTFFLRIFDAISTKYRL
jgi:predicted transcriptional regulator